MRWPCWRSVPLLVCCLSCLFAGNASGADAKLTEGPFRAALDKPNGQGWQGPLRDSLRELSQSTRVSILLDRRIDPATELNLLPQPQPLKDLVAAKARAVNLESTVFGHVVFVGPTGSTKAIQSLLTQRSDELTQLTGERTTGAKNVWPPRRAALHKKQSLEWEDLDTPRDILRQASSRYSIAVDGIDELPHDLWAAGSLPQMTLVESLTAILFQFGATFEFVPDRLAVKMIPIPAALLADAKGGNSKTSDPKKSATPTDPKSNSAGNVPKSKGTVSLRSMKFDLVIENAPIGVIFETLRKQGIAIVADEREFEAADLPFDKKIDLQGKDKNGETLCRDLAKKLGCEIKITGNTVYLTPPKRR